MDTLNQGPDNSRQDATSRDEARQVATSDDMISIKEAREIFLAKGREITERTLQRYCDKKQLDGMKRVTAEGEKWFVRKSSVFTRLAELEEFDRLRAPRPVATGRDLSPSVAEAMQENFAYYNERQATSADVSQPTVVEHSSHPTTIDMSRPTATSRDMSRDQAQHDETVEHKNVTALSARERDLYEQILETYKDQIIDLKKDKTLLQDDKRMLTEQLISKDKQIEHFFSSERDTKKLFGSLQNIMTYLWPNSKRKKQTEDLPQAYGPVVRDMPDGLDDRQ